MSLFNNLSGSLLHSITLKCLKFWFLFQPPSLAPSLPLFCTIDIPDTYPAIKHSTPCLTLPLSNLPSTFQNNATSFISTFFQYSYLFLAVSLPSQGRGDISSPQEYIASRTVSYMFLSYTFYFHTFYFHSFSLSTWNNLKWKENLSHDQNHIY